MLLILIFFSTIRFAIAKPGLSIHCGPDELPSVYSEEIANSLAKTFTTSAEFLYDDKQHRKYLLNVIEIGCLLQLPVDVRVGQIANVFADMRNMDIDEKILFAAEFEATRIEQWAKKLKLIGLSPRQTVLKAMNVPLEQEEIWKGANHNTRKILILAKIKADLCKYKF